MKSVSIQFEDQKRPLYQVLADQLEEKIKKGIYKSGQKLPSYRKLIAEYGVNLSTVTHAVKLLEEKQYVLLKQGAGVFVTSKIQDNEKKQTIHLCHPAKEDINFMGNNPNKAVYPIQNFDSILKGILHQDGEDVFDYQEIEGYLPLRKTICRYLNKYQNIFANYRDVIVVSGSQQGIDLISRSVAQRGDVVFIEKPTYTGLKNSFAQAGALVYGIPLKQDGVDLEQLERMIQIYHPKFLCITSTFQTPTTISYRQDTISSILRLADKYNFYLIEDDILSDINFGAPRNFLKSQDRSDRVFYIKSFSKITMPGVRLGFVVVPKVFRERVAAVKENLDVSLSGLFQRWLNVFLREHIEEHLKKIVSFYEEKYQIALAYMKELTYYNFNYEEPEGGFNFWIKLPGNLSMKPFYEYCVSRGVYIMPSQSFYGASQKEDYFRLCYVQNENEKLIRGIELLKTAYLKCRN